MDWSSAGRWQWHARGRPCLARALNGSDAGALRKCRVQPGLTGTSTGLEQGGSAAVGTAAMVAYGAGARCCGGSSGQGLEKAEEPLG